MRISDWSSDVCSSDLPTSIRSYARPSSSAAHNTFWTLTELARPQLVSMANSLPPIRFHPPRIRLDSAAMRKLYHHWLSPFSRQVRILLKEKGLDFQLEVKQTWERREDFLALNPAALVPVQIGRPAARGK